LFNFYNSSNILKKLDKIQDSEKLKVYHLAFLAFLDSMGYSKRVSKSTHQELFKKVLKRYIKTVADIINNPYLNEKRLGITKVLKKSNAQSLNFDNNSIDGVYNLSPKTMGGCRGVKLSGKLEELGFRVETREYFQQMLFPSEVILAYKPG